MFHCTLKNLKLIPIKYGTSGKITLKSTDRKKKKINKIPINNPKSPIRFMINALIADLLA